jgi:adenosine deaminase
MLDLKTFPKIENHLHLEGAIPLDSLWQLVKKYGGDNEIPDLKGLKEKFEYRDFCHFLEIWTWKNNFLREYEDFTFITDSVLTDLAGQNIKYAEIFFSPSAFREKLNIQRITEAISAGIRRHKEIRINLIADLVRNFGPQNELRTLKEINEVKDYGIIGIGIGGPEKEYPPELFTGIYDEARKLGFRTTAHAGEGAGPESIWSAVRHLKPERIGHGTRAAEDEDLVRYLGQNKIPVELCILSNLRTKVIGSVEEHPVRKFIDMGIPVSINTDDPKMFGNSLVMEYQALHDVFGYTNREIFRIILNSIDTTWLDQDEKDRLVSQFKTEAGIEE